jgi:pyroglutamyl-peptidase
VSTTVLITGFGPFPGAPVNPTELLATMLAARRPRSSGDRRIAHIFRTSYAAVDTELPDLLARHRPDVVLLFGLAARTAHLRVETRALNSRSLLSADVDGSRPQRTAIDPSAPPALHGHAPHRKLVAAARSTGVPARLSGDAGRYLCNFAYWRALECAGRHDDPLVQFVHVPTIRSVPTPRWRGNRRLSLDDLVQSGEAILAALTAAARDRSRVVANTEPAQPVAAVGLS